MDFRRILPEIRCQSCLSPGSEPTPRGAFSPLLGWAFGPRKFMKNCHADFIATHERPGTDKTGMDFRRILPEICCQSCLSPGSEPTPRGGFSNLLGWAFGPRNFMKNAVSLRRFPDVRGGFSPLSGLSVGMGVRPAKAHEKLPW